MQHFLIICKLLYCALVRSHLEYTSVVWNSDQKYLIDKIEAIQNNFLAWLKWKFKSTFECTSVSEMRTMLGILNLKDRRLLSDVMFFSDALTGKQGFTNTINIKVPLYLSREIELFNSVYHCSSPEQRCAKSVNKLSQFIDIFSDDFKTLKNKIIKYVLDL